MQDWQSQFDAMRASFVARAGERLNRVDSLLERLYCTPDDRELLLEVRQHFHWLCGVGGTYKLPQVSDLGWEGEELIDRLAEACPAVTDISRLQGLLVAVRQQFKTVEVA